MKIEARENIPGLFYKDCPLVEVIDRKPFHRGFLGNFVPHYARYKGKVYLLRGDLDYAYMHGHDEEDVPVILIDKVST